MQPSGSIGLVPGITISLAGAMAGPVAMAEYQDFENYAPSGSTYLAFAAPWSLYNAPDMGVPEYRASSETRSTIGPGTKSFVVQPGKGFAAGRRVVALINGDWSNNMEGDVLSYDPVTGELLMAVDPARIGGNGTSSDWIIYQHAKQGVDYRNTIQVNPATFPDGTLITSRWADNLQIGIGGALGYNMISQGNYNRGVPAVATAPVRINELSSATHEVAWSWVLGDRENANVLDEWYVTAAEGNQDTKLAEIGFFLHAPRETIAFHAAGRQIGSYTDEHARSWKVAQQPTGDAGNFLMLIRTDESDVTSSTLDLRRLMFWLVDKGEISGNAWLNGTAVGVEPLGSTTAVRFDRFRAVQKKVADGTPGAVLRLAVADQTQTSVTLSFEELAGDVTHYEARLNGGRWMVLAPDKTIAGLPEGSTVSIEVRGVNGSAAGAASRSITARLGGVRNVLPPAAANDSGEWTATNMTPPADGFADSSGGATARRSLETATYGNHFRQFVVRDLTPAAQEYWFRARLKGVGREWAFLHVFAGSFAGDYRRHFSLVTEELGVIGGAGADLTYLSASNASAPNGYRDIAIRFRKAQGVTTLYLRAGSADADGNINFAGDPDRGLLFDGTEETFRLEAV